MAVSGRTQKCFSRIHILCEVLMKPFGGVRDDHYLSNQIPPNDTTLQDF